MPLLGGRAYPAYGEQGAFVIGTRRDVWRGHADMTPTGETRGDLMKNERGRIVNAEKSANARERYMGPEGARLRARNACAAANCGTDAQLGAYGDVSYVARGRQQSAAARLARLQAASGMVGRGEDVMGGKGGRRARRIRRERKFLHKIGFGYDDDVMGGKHGRGRRKARRFFKDFGRGLVQGVSFGLDHVLPLVPLVI